MAEKLNISDLISGNSCFDLQFRKDTRHERLNSPTYYRWKAQLVVTASMGNLKTLSKVKKIMDCGKLTAEKNQARFSVQNMDDIMGKVVPYFKKNRLEEKKQKEFELWRKAVEIICRNKGVAISRWERSDLLTLVEIRKSSLKYKEKPRNLKWISVAKDLADSRREKN